LRQEPRCCRPQTTDHRPQTTDHRPQTTSGSANILYFISAFVYLSMHYYLLWCPQDRPPGGDDFDVFDELSDLRLVVSLVTSAACYGARHICRDSFLPDFSCGAATVVCAGDGKPTTFFFLVAIIQSNPVRIIHTFLRWGSGFLYNRSRSRAKSWARSRVEG
jgi:hypothetical protein